MISVKNRNNVNYVRIVTILRHLRFSGLISESEFKRAKEYYKKVTGADISVMD